MVKSGHALNIVPAECESVFEVRSLPGVDATRVADRRQAYADSELLPKMRCDAMLARLAGHLSGGTA